MAKICGFLRKPVFLMKFANIECYVGRRLCSSNFANIPCNRNVVQPQPYQQFSKLKYRVYFFNNCEFIL